MLHVKLLIKIICGYMVVAAVLILPNVCSAESREDIHQIIHKEALEHNQSGLLYAKEKRYKLAIEQYNLAIALDEKSASYYFNRGEAMYNDKQYNKSIEDYTKAIELQPGNYKAYLSRAMSYAGTEQKDKAIGDLSQAIAVCTVKVRRKPDDAEAYVNRGWVYLMLNDAENAIADFSKALKIQPDQDNIYLFRGIANMIGYDFDLAIVDFRKAFALNPSNVEALLYCGDAYFYSDKREEAIGAYTKAIDVQPDNLEAYARRGIVYAFIGNKDAALSDFKKAEGLDKETSDLLSMQMLVGAIGYSHINGNVPGKDEFDKLLSRDIREYFNVREEAKVEYDFLRKGPEQVGVSPPYYFLWVKVHDNDIEHEGAMSMYVIDKKKFYVTSYIDREAIERDFSIVYKTFSLPQCVKISGYVKRK